MGSKKEERDGICKLEEERVFVKTCRGTAWFWSILMGVAGGLMLGWWEYEYHPTYRQLWMVPFGLILFATPAFIWFSVVVSGICNLKDDDDDDHVIMVSQPVHPKLSNPVPVMKDEQWSNHVDDV